MPPLTLPGKIVDINYPVLGAYHPAYVSRIGDFSTSAGVCATWYQDLAKGLGLAAHIHHYAFVDALPKNLGKKEAQ